MQNAALIIVENDDEEFILMKEALGDCPCVCDQRVKNGAELLDFLNARGRDAHSTSPYSSLLILSDLHMPVMDGHAVLKEIKGCPALRSIPVIIISGSAAQRDIDLAYELGASSFIMKPVGFPRWIEVFNAISKYWLETVAFPRQHRSLPISQTNS